MPCGWEGNHRSDIALVTCHTHLNERKQAPCLHSSCGMAHFTFLLTVMPSVLWHCCSGVRKSILSIKIECDVLVWLSVCSEVQIVCIWSSWCLCIQKSRSSLASFKSRLILPFWYRLTQVVPEKTPLNGCSSSNSNCYGNWNWDSASLTHWSNKHGP